MEGYQARVDELLADYRRSREQLAGTQRELAAATGTARSADGLITATVGARGLLTGLIIDPDAYRVYRPEDLARQIVATTTAAAVQALAAAGEVLAPALPTGADPRAATRDRRPTRQ